MKVLFSKRAEANFVSIIYFIGNKWGTAVVEAFKQKVSDFLHLIEKFPELGQVELEEKGIRGFQLTKQTRVFYRIKGQKVIILAFFDVRKNPTKRPR